MGWHLNEINETILRNISAAEFEGILVLLHLGKRQAAFKILDKQFTRLFSERLIDKLLDHWIEQHKPSCCMCGKEVSKRDALSEIPESGILCSTCVIHMNDGLFRIIQDRIKQSSDEEAIVSMKEQLKSLDDLVREYF